MTSGVIEGDQTSADQKMLITKVRRTPKEESQFCTEWVKYILKDHFRISLQDCNENSQAQGEFKYWKIINGNISPF